MAYGRHAQSLNPSGNNGSRTDLYEIPEASHSLIKPGLNRRSIGGGSNKIINVES